MVSPMLKFYKCNKHVLSLKKKNLCSLLINIIKYENLLLMTDIINES